MQLIVDFNPHGHHPDYVEALLANGFDGALLTSSALWREVSDCVKNTSKVTVKIMFEGMPSPREELEAILNLMRENKNNYECLHLHLDKLLYSNRMFLLKKAILLHKFPIIGGIWIGNNFVYPRKYYVKDWIKKILTIGFILIVLIRWRKMKIYFLNEDIFSFLQKFPFIKNQVHLCPDPFQNHLSYPPTFISNGKNEFPTILFLGYHNQRKGTEWALRALLKWKDPLRIIVGGLIENSSEINKICAKFRYPVQITLMDWRLSNQEISDLYSIASAVIMPYIRFGGSSGLFVNSLYRNIPVLAADWGIIGKRTKDLSAGRTFIPDSEEDFRKNLKLLISQNTEIQNNPAVKQFLHNNSPKMFYQTLTGKKAEWIIEKTAS